jgi:thioredoxin 1
MSNENDVRRSGSRGIAAKFVVLALVASAVAGVIYAKTLKARGEHATLAESAPSTGVTEGEQRLPRLVDVGKGTCIPCKMMAPVLDELASEYEGRMIVEFANMELAPEVASIYRIRLIPTQIFYGTDGSELFRHEGFISKEEILAKWAQFGYTFDGGAAEGGEVER